MAFVESTVEATPGPSTTADTSQEATPETKEAPGEQVNFKVIFNKQKYDITFALDESVTELKTHLATLTSEYIIIHCSFCICLWYSIVM